MLRLGLRFGLLVMDRRRAVALILALVICLGLLVRWVSRPDETSAVPAEQPVATIAPDAPAATFSIEATPRESAESGITSYDAPIGGGVFRGRVIDAVTRDPLREFTIQVAATRFPGSSPKPPKARSFRAKDGRFEYGGLPDGTWTIFATARGYQRFELPDVTVPSGKLEQEMLMPMRPGHPLRGRVFDATTNKGIPSATISFRESHVNRYEGNFRMRPSTTSQADGSFVLDGVTPGPVRITASANKYAAREMDVFISDKAAPLEIALSEGGAIVGYLAGADGLTPVAGKVSLIDVEDESDSVSATGSAGEFAYYQLRPGRYRLTGRSGRLTGEREITLSEDERLEGIVLALNAGRSIRGVVSGLRPGERERAKVLVFTGSDPAHAPQSEVDERGAYEIVGIPPGETRVIASVFRRRNITTVVEMPADSDLTVNFEFKPGSRLTGRVTRGGKPAAGATLVPISLSDADQNLFLFEAIANASGDYTLDEVPDGLYSFSIGSYVSPSVRVSGDTVFDIEIPEAQLSGRVFEEGSKVPVVGASVRVLPTQTRKIRPAGASSDHFGQFALSGLQPGEYVLSVYKPGYELYRAPLAYGLAISDMVVGMRPARGVELRVRDAENGKAVSQIQVLEIFNGRPGLMLNLSQDQTGVTYLPAGLAGASLRLMANGYAPIEIGTWNGQQLDLGMQRTPAP